MMSYLDLSRWLWGEEEIEQALRLELELNSRNEGVVLSSSNGAQWSESTQSMGKANQQVKSLESPCSTTSSSSYRECYWWDSLLQSSMDESSTGQMTSSLDSAMCSSDEFYSLKTMSMPPSPLFITDGTRKFSAGSLMSCPTCTAASGGLGAWRKLKRSHSCPEKLFGPSCASEQYTLGANELSVELADGKLLKKLDIDAEEPAELKELKEKAIRRRKRPDKLNLKPAEEMSQGQDNVIRECWVDEIGQWEELPHSISAPSGFGEERLPSYQEHMDKHLSSLLSQTSAIEPDFTRSIRGEELLQWLTTSANDPADVIQRVCSKLVQIGVLVNTSSKRIPEHSNFQLDMNYEWALPVTPTLPSPMDLKLKKLRQHNKNLKSRVNQLTERLNQLLIHPSCTDTMSHEIQVCSEGKTKTSVSTPNAFLSISTNSESSVNHVSLSFTDTDCRTPGYVIRNSSTPTTSVSFDSFKTATDESPNQPIRESAGDLSADGCSRTSADVSANQSALSNPPACWLNAKDSQTSRADDTQTIESTAELLCTNCRQLMTARSRLSNASIDSGLSQSCLGYPTCNLTGSESAPPILYGHNPLFPMEEDVMSSTTADDLISIGSNGYAESQLSNDRADSISLTNQNAEVPIAAPPPPPPPPMLLTQAVPRRKKLKPRVSLRPLHWRRILLPNRTVAKPQPTVWEKLDEPKVDIDELEELFSLDMQKKTMPAPVVRRRNFTKVLDRKRSQNLGIILSSIRQPFSEIKKALINFDVSFLAIDTWRSIYEARASEKELTEIHDQVETNPRCVLDKPEQFIYNLNNLQFGVDRIKCFLLRSHYEEVIKDVNSQLDNMDRVCELMTKSESIENLLSLLLAVGNYLNGASEKRGQADGFSLDILPKLKDIRGKKQMSLLQYIASKYKSRYGRGQSHVGVPLPSMTSLGKASHINYNELQKSLTTLRGRLSDCQALLVKVETTLAEHSCNQPFYDVMSSFVSESAEAISQLFDRISSNEAKFQHTCQFFSAPNTDCKAITPSHFFDPWLTFSRDLNSVWNSKSGSLPSRASAHF